MKKTPVQPPQPIPTPKLTLSRKEVAALLGISERLLWTLTNSRRIPHVRLGARIVYPIKELEAWLEDRAGKSVK